MRSAPSSSPKPKVSNTRRFSAASASVQARKWRPRAPIEKPIDLAMLPPMPALPPRPCDPYARYAGTLRHPRPTRNRSLLGCGPTAITPCGGSSLDSAPAALHLLGMGDDAELLIAGGGLNGLLLGIACAGAGLGVALVDRENPAAMLDQGFDGRSSAIAYGSQQVLSALGLWPRIAAEAEPILEIRVADDNAPLFLHYDHRELETGTPLGYVVENRVLRRALIERARSLTSLSFLAPLAVESAETSPFAAVAALSDGRRVTARLVAAADGQASPLRRAAGIGIVEWRYRQTGIVTTARHERPHGGIAIEHFLPAGPFAILPMTGNRSSIVWTERAELAERLIALHDAAFAAELAARFGDFLGAVEPIGPRWAYPLGLMLAERYAARRLALVGE